MVECTTILWLIKGPTFGGVKGINIMIKEHNVIAECAIMICKGACLCLMVKDKNVMIRVAIGDCKKVNM